MSGSPINQLFRRIAPSEAEGRLDEGLAAGGRGEEEKEERSSDRRELVDGSGHGRSLARGERGHKVRCGVRGFALLEVTLALGILTVIGLLMLKLSLNIVHPRQWMMQQALSDAYLTGERARAERISFADLTAEDAEMWTDAGTTDVAHLGTLPGGREVVGTVTRVRTADPLNPGEQLHEVGNPAAMKIWTLKSTLTYTIGGREYQKSRTVIRMQ